VAPWETRARSVNSRTPPSLLTSSDQVEVTLYPLIPVALKAATDEGAEQELNAPNAPSPLGPELAGLTVTVKVIGVPGQPLAVGVTVIVATTGTAPLLAAV